VTPATGIKEEPPLPCPGRPRDRGSASLWLAAVGLVLVAAGVAGSAVGVATVAHHQARTAADLGALAGAARVVEGTDAACRSAAEIASANRARLVSCAVDGWEIVVTVEVAAHPLPALNRTASASARAGPVGVAARQATPSRAGPSRAKTGQAQGQFPASDVPVGSRRWLDAREGVAPAHRVPPKEVGMELSLAARTVAGHTVLEVGGEVDVYTAPKLRERLAELIDAGAAKVVVDLDRVDFLDSTGLGVLVGAHKRLRASGGTFGLVCSKEPLLKIFRITALDQVFPLYDSVNAATGAAPGPTA
jgi:anti-sigma B factor antagonist